MREGNGVMRMTMASLVALSVTAMTSGAALGQTIRIGASVALSGSLSREGQLLREGYAFWADQINQSGGISVGGKRHTVQLVVYDDESNAATSERLTEKLITQDKVQFLLGPYSSPITLETSLIGEKRSPCSTSASSRRSRLRGQYILVIERICRSSRLNEAGTSHGLRRTD
jgi:ABC-type branched-subunit amino acid transport system substrate-binding protein